MYQGKNESKKLFFGFLVSKLKFENKKFLNTATHKSFRVQQSTDILWVKSSRFTYQHNGEQKESKIKLNLSIVSDLEILKSHPLKNIEIISHVKVCDFHLNDNDLLLEIYEEILTNTGINFTLDAKAARGSKQNGGIYNL